MYVFRLYVDELDQDITIGGEELVTNSWADWLDFVDWVDEWLELILRETVLVMLVCVVVRLVILEESASDVGTKELQVVVCVSGVFGEKKVRDVGCNHMTIWDYYLEGG
jgi:hypothetical protein